MAYVSSWVSYKSVVAVFQAVPFEVGVIDDAGELKNITLDGSAQITVDSGDATIFSSGGRKYIRANSFASVILRIEYEDFLDFNSVVPTVNTTAITEETATDVSLSYLPPKSYTRAEGSFLYAMMFSWGSMYSSLAGTLRQVFSDYYAFSANTLNWQTELNDYYLDWQDSFDYSLVVQTFNNISSARSNKYDLTKLLTTYIYGRLGKDLFVLIDTPEIASEAWVLNQSVLGVSTILSPSEAAPPNAIIYIKDFPINIPQNFINELLLFAKKVFPISAQIEIIVTPTFDAFNVFLEVGDVYDHDPRLLAPFALKYTSQAVDDVVALTTPFNPAFLVGIDYTPSGGNIPLALGTVTLESFALYDADGVIYILPITNQTTFISSDPSVIDITDNVGTLLMDGTTDITASFEGKTREHTFTVTGTAFWELDVSDLDNDTILS